ncbi:MAG: hypothetical protein AABX70_05000 [Nanoarchaeota archaeon]
MKPKMLRNIALACLVVGGATVVRNFFQNRELKTAVSEIVEDVERKQMSWNVNANRLERQKGDYYLETDFTLGTHPEYDIGNNPEHYILGMKDVYVHFWVHEKDGNPITLTGAILDVDEPIVREASPQATWERYSFNGFDFLKAGLEALMGKKAPVRPKVISQLTFEYDLASNKFVQGGCAYDATHAMPGSASFCLGSVNAENMPLLHSREESRFFLVGGNDYVAAETLSNLPELTVYLTGIAEFIKEDHVKRKERLERE